MSPAQLIFGRPLADFLPSHPAAYTLHPHWSDQIDRRQRCLQDQQDNQTQRYNFGTRPLPLLDVGQHVVIQNKTKRHYNRWDRYGTILETLLSYRQY